MDAHVLYDGYKLYVWDESKGNELRLPNNGYIHELADNFIDVCKHNDDSEESGNKIFSLGTMLEEAINEYYD